MTLGLEPGNVCATEGTAMSVPVEPSMNTAGNPAYIPFKQEPGPDPKAAAQRVMDTGDRRFMVDNYEARMIALAHELGKGDPLYREQLMEEIFRLDHGALQSWLTPGRVNLLTQQGHISKVEQSQIAESLAAAYNNNDIPMRHAVPNINSGSGQFNYSSLDDLVWEPSSASAPGARAEKAQHIREFLDLMNSSSGPETAKFRQNYAQHLIKEYVVNPKAAGTDQQQVAAVIATNLLGGSDKAADVLAQYDDAQIQTILESASKGIDTLAIKGANISYNGHLLENVDIPDGAAALISSIANTSNTNAHKVAGSIARLPAQSPDMFKGDLGKGRADAMGNLFVNHSDAILKRFTEYDKRHVGGSDHPSLQQFGLNSAELGSLFRTVLFNKDAPYADAARAKVLEYATTLKKEANQPAGSADAEHRLAMLSASAGDALTQGWNELKKDKDGKKEMIGFFVDLAFAALPTDKLNGQASKAIGALFGGDTPRAGQIEELLKPVEGSLFDAATGKLTDSGKEAVLKALGEDAAELVEQQDAVIVLQNSLTSGLNEDSKGDVETDDTAITANLNGWRAEGGVA